MSPADARGGRLDDLIRSRSMLIVVGSGGVGKTTLSASLALRGAVLGRKVLVLTIDPARRLAQALGLDAFHHDAHPVPLEGVDGALHAMMLDTKSTFDDLIERLAPNDEVRDRILANTLYKNLSNALAGSHEYMAMEQLYNFHAEGHFDLLVLDTPPTHHALDFLDAPRRILDFLSDDTLQWFIRPYFAQAAGRGMRFLEKTTQRALAMLEKVTGLEALRDVSEFFQAFSDMYGDFKVRAERVSALLTSEEAAYVLVTGPAPVTVAEARYFYEKLREHDLRPQALVLNRMHDDYDAPETLPAVSGRSAAAELARRMVANLDEMRRAGRVDQSHVDGLLAVIDPSIQVCRVPLLGTDAVDLKALREIHASL